MSKITISFVLSSFRAFVIRFFCFGSSLTGLGGER